MVSMQVCILIFFPGYGVSMIWTSTIKIAPHYFKVRLQMAYMATGLGYGIGRTVFPYIIASIYEATSYRNAVLFTAVLFAQSLSAPIFYIEQLPRDCPKSAAELLKAYIKPLHRFIAPFHLANAYLWIAELTGITIIMYTYVAHATENDTAAVNVQTINGAMQIAGAASLIAFLVKFKINQFALQIVCNVLIGAACIVFGTNKNICSFYLTAGALGFMESILYGNILGLCHHLYPADHVVYAFGFHEVFGGIAGFATPYTISLIQQRWGDEAGFYYLAACSFLAGLVYIVSYVVRPVIWKPFPEIQKLCNEDQADEAAAEMRSSLL